MQGLTYFVCITELGHFVSVVEGLKGEKGEIIALEGGARERKRDHAWCLFSREVLGMFARFHCSLPQPASAPHRCGWGEDTHLPQPSSHLLVTAVGGAYFLLRQGQGLGKSGTSWSGKQGFEFQLWGLMSAHLAHFPSLGLSRAGAGRGEEQEVGVCPSHLTA